MILKGKTQKGKTRVREHGEIWGIISEKDRVNFSSEDGPWLLICPVPEMSIREPRNLRWVHKWHDDDFKVVI